MNIIETIPAILSRNECNTQIEFVLTDKKPGGQASKPYKRSTKKISGFVIIKNLGHYHCNHQVQECIILAVEIHRLENSVLLTPELYYTYRLAQAKMNALSPLNIHK